MAAVRYNIEQLELAAKHLQEAVRIMRDLNLGSGDAYDRDCMQNAYNAMVLMQGLATFMRQNKTEEL